MQPRIETQPADPKNASLEVAEVLQGGLAGPLSSRRGPLPEHPQARDHSWTQPVAEHPHCFMLPNPSHLPHAVCCFSLPFSKKIQNDSTPSFSPVCFGLKHPKNNPRHCMVSLFLCIPHHCHLTKRGITDICPFAPNPFQGQQAQKDPQAAAKLTHPTQPFTGQNQHISFPGFSSSAPHAPWGPSVPATVLQSPSNPGPVHVPTPPSRCLGPKPSVWFFF